MRTPSLVLARAEVEPDTAVYVELLRVGDAFVVRQIDEEAHEVINLIHYPSEQAAREGYREFVRRALGR